MAPRRKRKLANSDKGLGPGKKPAKVDPERLICERTLRTMDEREAMTTEDRLTLDEKKQLLEAYNQCGFSVFQDMRQLQQYIPGRTETDLKGLIARLKIGIESTDAQDDDHLHDWQRLCLNLMGVYSRQKQTNVDDVLADALKRVAEELELSEEFRCDNGDLPNYPQLLRSIAQLLVGRFPDKMSPMNSRMSMRLFNHINELAESIDSNELQNELGDEGWLARANQKRRDRQDMAISGIDEADTSIKLGLTVRDLEKNGSINALCMELPKIKRITELLNPLMINESLASVLFDAISRD